jgi:molybdopterin-containing oxidoreductase family membrane subunit
VGLFATIFAVLRSARGCLIGRALASFGLQNPVGWAFDIINFVFWIGIAHSVR